MTQQQWMVLAFRTVAAGGFVTPLLWIAYYTRHSKWWKDEIGKSLVYNALCAVAESVIWLAALFLHLSGTSGRVAGWAYVGLLGLVTPIMLNRLWVWRKAVRAGSVISRRVPHCASCTCKKNDSAGSSGLWEYRTSRSSRTRRCRTRSSCGSPETGSR